MSPAEAQALEVLEAECPRLRRDRRGRILSTDQGHRHGFYVHIDHPDRGVCCLQLEAWRHGARWDGLLRTSAQVAFDRVKR